MMIPEPSNWRHNYVVKPDWKLVLVAAAFCSTSVYDPNTSELQKTLDERGVTSGRDTAFSVADVGSDRVSCIPACSENAVSESGSLIFTKPEYLKFIVKKSLSESDEKPDEDSMIR
ncbi:hypothetical protein RRG08_052077 [Elysia crispata]|uniref:Uncharacterized protein n=1 Tax=Elysia crispata TaxID=231223 RepID=A0AAE1A598_9GAST|nr:hypothetical protein RRG08_052077 [Elysia crispata]